MESFRVIVDGNSGDGFNFRIEDVVPASNPFLSSPRISPFAGYPQGICSARSVENLKKKLQQMVNACDLPVLVLTEPELKEWK